MGKFRKKASLKIDISLMKNYIIFMFTSLKIKIIPLIILNVITLITVCLSGSGIALITRNIVDEVFIQQHVSYLNIIIPIFIAYYIIASLMDIITMYVALKWKIGIDYKMKYLFYKRVVDIQNDCLKGITATDLYYRMSVDGSTLTQYLYVLCVKIPTNIILCFVFLFIMLNWSVELTIYTLFLIAFQMISQHFIKSPIEKINIRQKKMEQSLLEFLMEKFQFLDISKTLNLDSWWGKEVYNRLENAGLVSRQNFFQSDCLNRIVGFIQQFWTIGFLILGAILITHQKCSVGTILGFQTLINCLLTPLQAIFINILSFQETKVAFKRYIEYFNLPIIKPTQGKKINFRNKLSVVNLHFSYSSSERTVFKDINFEFYANSLVGIVGDNGSGKTTLMKLCARLLTPDQGDILIDGISIKDISYNSYRQNISFMLQIPVLLNDTLKNNLLLGSEVDEEDLVNIMQICALKDVAERLPEGINTKLGRNDIMLSNGEMQRLCLARILLKKPKVIWLDEPTASLDQKSEKIILEALVQYRTKTHALVIINTHSKKVLEYVDIIYRL